VKFVLDSSALLAALLSEPGGEVVGPELGNSLMLSVNLAEVAASLRADDNDDEAVREIIDQIAIPFVAADAVLAIDAGLMRTVTDRSGLSLGDRFCLALARRAGLAVLTADRAWSDVAEDLGVTIVQIR
jgi:ribonuclease VapC